MTWVKESADRYVRSDGSSVNVRGSRGRWSAYVTGPNNDGGAPIRQKGRDRGVRCPPALMTWAAPEPAMAAVDALKPLATPEKGPAS